MLQNAIYVPQFKQCYKDILIKDNKFYLVDFHNETKFILVNVDFYDGFVYDDKNLNCYFGFKENNNNSINKLNDLGIYDFQFNFLMGLTAILVGFSFLIGLVIVGATR